MKALPKLLSRSTVTIQAVAPDETSLIFSLSGKRSWPHTGRVDLDPPNNIPTLRVWDCENVLLLETINPTQLPFTHFGFTFMGVTHSEVNFKTKSQSLTAKMRLTDLDTHEAIYGTDFSDYED